jgi:hypothetical protein
MSEWWEQPYPRNSSPPEVELPRNLRVGVPDGPDVLAMKRGLWRGGRWPGPASSHDDTYSQNFSSGKSGGNVGDSGVRGYQRQMKLDDDGEIGPQTFEAMRVSAIPQGLPNAGQPLFDQTAVNQLKKAAEQPAGGGGGAAALTDYAKRSINSEPKIHYSQNRPMTHLGIPPEQGFTADCSGHATSSWYEAGWPDPNGYDYNGSGWTGSLISHNPKCSLPWQVGDLGIYGTSPSNTTHVVTCFQGGDNSTARWVSHGSEQGPYSVLLYYRSDLVSVVRPAKS